MARMGSHVVRKDPRASAQSAVQLIRKILTQLRQTMVFKESSYAGRRLHLHPSAACPPKPRAMAGPIRGLSSPLLRGFTLVELLVVMGIVVVLLGLATAALVPALSASKLNTAGSMLSDQFNLARQHAISQNTSVELRFYRLPSAGSSGPQFRAVRAMAVDKIDPTKVVPITKLQTLPEPILITDNTKLSTLLDHANAAFSGITASQETLPGQAAPVDYVSFAFNPDGGTSLKPVSPPDGNWFLTIFSETGAKDAATGLPDNYYTIQIEPVTGRARTYRP